MSMSTLLSTKPTVSPASQLTPAPFGSLQRKCACGGSSRSSGDCEACKKKATLQRRAGNGAQPNQVPPIVHDALRTPGRPLDGGTRAFFEPRFGHDFGKVRVHTDAAAAESARAINALAYTVGRDVVFGAGQYQPNAAGGRQLLGHELTHVVQQSAQAPSTHQLRIGPSDDAYEREADRTAANLTEGKSAASGVRGAPLSVQRACGPAQIGRPSGCTPVSGDVAGEHYLFNVNCDTFKPGYEKSLRDFAATLTSGGSLKIHGFASEEGDPTFNENLSCARAVKGQQVIDDVLVPKGVSVNYSLFLHGATAGDRDDRRSITIEWLPAGPEPPGPTPPAPACDAAKQSERVSACIEPVVIADDDGKNPTTATDATAAQNIWSKCCIDLTVSAGKTVKKSSYKTLDESPTNTPTAEETSLFADAGSSSCIQVFVPALLAQGGATGKDISGGGGTYDGGTANPKIVLVEGAVGEVLAHEIGHAMGFAGHDANPTVMKPTGHYNVPNDSAVSAGVCSGAKTGAVLTKKGGAKDCCLQL